MRVLRVFSGIWLKVWSSIALKVLAVCSFGLCGGSLECGKYWKCGECDECLANRIYLGMWGSVSCDRTWGQEGRGPPWRGGKGLEKLIGIKD